MFGWMELGATWPTEQAYQALELLKQNRIRCRMPSDDMFFISPFSLPHPDRRWAIRVRRRDVDRAMALLAGEGLARIAEEAEAAAVRPSVQPEAARPVIRYPVPAAPAAQPSNLS